MNLKYREFPFEVRSDEAEDEGIISGYASTYSVDSYGDRIEPGAFGGSIQEKRGKVPLLFGHDSNTPIGFTTSLAEDHKGLAMTARIALRTTAGRDAFELVKMSRAVDHKLGLSIGFTTREADMDGDTRILKAIDLWEVSIAMFPANRMARIEDAKSVRSLERLLRDEAGLSAAEAKRVMALVGGHSPSASREVEGLRQLARTEQLSRTFREVFGG